MIETQDEYTHTNTGEANFNESMYFNFYDRDHNLGGFVRLGNRPNESYAELTLALYQADGTALFMYQRPEISSNERLDAGGMCFETIEPLVHLRSTYEGPALWLAEPLDLKDPRKAFTSNPYRNVKLSLDYTGLSPVYGGVLDDETAAQQEITFAKGHYEQITQVRGKVAVGDEVTSFEGFGLRDHSWGPRSWQSPRSYRWLTCVFDSGFGFMGSLITTENGHEMQGGFVFRNGVNEAVERVTIDTAFAEAGNYQERINATLYCASGPFVVSGEVIGMLPLRNRRHEKTTHIREGMTRWHHEDHVGYGLSEYLDQSE